MRFINKSVLLFALSAIAFVGHAGNRYVYEVNLYKGTSYGYASGAIADVRGSSDSIQLIVCYNNVSSGGIPSASCTVVNKDGLMGGCYTSDSAKVQAIRSLGPESYLFLTWEVKTGLCDYVSVTNGSLYKPWAVSGF
jgi:hypothetical protein